ncbi:hypothetical protein [Synoicihabitans lomoniglobus]|uniref:Uncharacterized protein n=1 Tax=Synoicihabitans lomoniglobus TaxID=2909285 RepID=A0AAE9ZVD3_9BACT|nr:hypothetical protein [Opitutaceae bacterium LMO-M01]WED63779.1 hypothetical protein PXH66_15690 [Opitutaceae bacterium LMO-M01]
MTAKEMMAEITAQIGPIEARKLVLDAYNAEIVSNRLGRLEHQGQTRPPLVRAKRDLLELAVERVHQVVSLME